MIIIDAERCDGCGACVEVCPTGALHLVDGRVTLDGALCRQCEACLAACPNGAIIFAVQEEPVAEAIRLPALLPKGPRRLEPEAIPIRVLPATLPLRSRALPVIGAALAWTGREILPWLADLLLDTLDRYTTRLQAKGSARSRKTSARGEKGKGRRRRHRQRVGRA